MGSIVSEYTNFLKRVHNIISKAIPFTGIVFVNFFLIFWNGKVNVRAGEWAFLPLSYMNAVAAIWIYFCVAAYICGKFRGMASILCYIGKNSIVFVCTNHLIIRISSKLLEIVQKYSLTIHCVLQETLVFVISIILMLGLSEIFSRTKLRFFIGK